MFEMLKSIDSPPITVIFPNQQPAATRHTIYREHGGQKRNILLVSVLGYLRHPLQSKHAILFPTIAFRRAAVQGSLCLCALCPP